MAAGSNSHLVFVTCSFGVLVPKETVFQWRWYQPFVFTDAALIAVSSQSSQLAAGER